MRFPDVFGKAVSFTQRIAGSRVENGSGAVQDADTHPCDVLLIPPAAGGPSHPHKSTCHHVCVSARLRID